VVVIPRLHPYPHTHTNPDTLSKPENHHNTQYLPIVIVIIINMPSPQNPVMDQRAHKVETRALRAEQGRTENCVKFFQHRSNPDRGEHAQRKKRITAERELKRADQEAPEDPF
jgi:hypothetical protein